MMKKILTAIGALLLACSLPLSGTAASNQPFADVPPTKHFAQAVNDLAARNIIGGYPDGTYRPGNSITRGQAAAIIAKMTGLDMTDVKNPGFKDVTTANGYYKAIAAMAQQEIIGGYPDGTYKPNAPISRKHMAAILVKAFNLPRAANLKNPFEDPVGITEEILIIYKFGITTGTTPTTFSPNAFITRGQAAKMLQAAERVGTSKNVSMSPADLGMSTVRSVEEEVEVKSKVVNAVLVKHSKDFSKQDFSKDQVQLTLLKEGKAIFFVRGQDSGEERETIYKQYQAEVVKVDGELKLTLEETNVVQPTNFRFNLSDAEIKRISLTAMDGEPLVDSVEFSSCNSSERCLTIEGPGQYIATVYLTDGDKKRYGIEATARQGQDHYNIRYLEERITDVHREDEKHNLGKVSYPKDSVVAAITRDKGTNVFRVTGKKAGSLSIDYEHTATEPSGLGPGEYPQYRHIEGLYVRVDQIGTIINVWTKQLVQSEH